MSRGEVVKNKIVSSDYTIGGNPAPLYYNPWEGVGDVLSKYGIKSTEELKDYLKQTIRPKFAFLQTVYIVDKSTISPKGYSVRKGIVAGIEFKFDRRNNFVCWYLLHFEDDSRYKFLEKNIYTTEEEAEKVLKEIKERHKDFINKEE